jgi:hypothetical protein
MALPGTIPVLRTVASSYASLRAGFEDLARMARRWAIGAGVSLAVPVLLLQGVPADGSGDASAGGRAAAATALFAAVAFLAIYSLVIRWHRKLILGQGADDTRPRSLSASLLYMARSSLLFAVGFGIAMLAFVPLVFVKGTVSGDLQNTVAGVILAVGVFLALLLAVRVSLILPAAAVSDFRMTMSRSYALTRGNSLRLLAGTALSAGPAVALSVFIRGLGRSTDAQAGDVPQFIALTVLTTLLLCGAAIVQASFLSFSYLHFTADERSGRPGAAGVAAATE